MSSQERNDLLCGFLISAQIISSEFGHRSLRSMNVVDSCTYINTPPPFLLAYDLS
jgi:hypothetical protein